MNKVVKNIWERLDRDSSGVIEQNEILDLLNFTAILHISYILKKYNLNNTITINKYQIKSNLLSLSNWIIQHKMNLHKFINLNQYLFDMHSWLLQYADEMDANNKNV